LGGGYFDSVEQLMASDSTTNGRSIATTIAAAEAGLYNSFLGHICEWEKRSGSPTLYDPEYTSVRLKAAGHKNYLIGYISVAVVVVNVTSLAGICKV
jgi:pectin lyase